MKVTAGIRVKNGERFAEECLTHLSEYVDEIVIFDNGSTDDTVKICESFKKVTNVMTWNRSFFHEGIDRNVLLAMIKNTSPDWILVPDIDEVFEDRIKDEIQDMIRADDVVLYGFLFYHFWRSRTHYRVDGKWKEETSSHPIARLFRNTDSLYYPLIPIDGSHIAGVKGRCVLSDIHVKHYGHLYEDISRQKQALYSSVDPNHDYSYMTDETGLELAEYVEPPGQKEKIS